MHDILNLKQFPLDRPESPDWRALVQRCRADLVQNGMFNLEGLMLPAVAAIEAAMLGPKFASESFHHARRHNIYFKKNISGLAEDHPALTQFETSNQTLCADQLHGSALMRLYEWPEFATFLAAAMQQDILHTMPDPLARVNVMSYAENQALNWHFDRSEFTTTLLLQAPDQGGAFEYRTDLRSDQDPNYDGVARVLAGQDPDVKQLTLSPGTLNVFKGLNTAHRVTPVEGKQTRIIAVFSFYDRPDVRFSAEEQIGFYGRSA